MILCTLFDSKYLDKAMVMIDSLYSLEIDYKLYVLPMDEACEEILTAEKIPNIELIDYQDFIKKEHLEEIKISRPLVEFYYACTPHLIEYVLEYKNERICTYVDADLFFYHDPHTIVEEIGNKDAQIIKHWFTKSLVDVVKEKKTGTFCVEFNTFKNTSNGRELLTWWKNNCREYTGYKNGLFGDQKYLDEWRNHPNVSIVENKGAGVAPWNINQYKYVHSKNNKIIIRKRGQRQIFPLIFYHFENIHYIDDTTANINVYKLFFIQDDKFVNTIYSDYLKRINKKKVYLKERYGIISLISAHPSSTTHSTESKSTNERKSIVNTVIHVKSKLLYKFRHNKDLFKMSI